MVIFEFSCCRFWLVDCQNVYDAVKMATELYQELVAVPFLSKFVVFAKREDVANAKVRLFCMTDDKMDKTLECQEQFTEIARSKDTEVRTFYSDIPRCIFLLFVTLLAEIVPKLSTSLGIFSGD
jgi:UPA domain